MTSPHRWRYTVELFAEDVDGWRSMGSHTSYPLRWLAERRARREQQMDERIGQDLGRWRVVDRFGP